MATTRKIPVSTRHTNIYDYIGAGTDRTLMTYVVVDSWFTTAPTQYQIIINMHIANTGIINYAVRFTIDRNGSAATQAIYNVVMNNCVAITLGKSSRWKNTTYNGGSS